MELRDDDDLYKSLKAAEEEIMRERKKQDIFIHIFGWISVAFYILAFVCILAYTVVDIIKDFQ